MDELKKLLESRLFAGQAIYDNCFVKIDNFQYKTGYVDGAMNAYREIYDYLRRKEKNEIYNS